MQQGASFITHLFNAMLPVSPSCCSSLSQFLFSPVGFTLSVILLCLLWSSSTIVTRA